MKAILQFGMLAIVTAVAAHAQEAVTLHFYERPPYMVKNSDGSASGLTADPTRAAFERSGIAFQWALTPAKRQLKKIQSNDGLDCGVGWYRNAERDAVGKFTRTVYQDKPTVVIARVAYQPAHATLVDLLADPKVSLVVKDGLTYGSYVFGQLSHAKAQVRKVTDEQPSIARMVAAGHADFMLSPQEEADILIAGSQAGPGALKVFSFPDIAQGDTRHIFCSNKVSDATIDKLNQALDQAAKSPVKGRTGGKTK